MPYKDPTITEIMISMRISRILKKVERLANHIIGTSVNVTLVLSPKNQHEGDILTYISTGMPDAPSAHLYVHDDGTNSVFDAPHWVESGVVREKLSRPTPR